MAVTVSCPMACGGQTQRHARQLGRSRRERLQTKPEPGRDRAADERAVRGDDVEVVAVPRSTTIAGAPYRRAAARALTSRSSPTVEGWSTRIGIGTVR